MKGILVVIGGITYLLLELLWRGHTHWTMFLVGGMCFFLIGAINEVISWNVSFLKQCLIGAVIVTIVEFIAGCIINLWLGLNVWDYSNIPGNILGQICPQYTLLWSIVAAGAIILDDYLRYWLFDEEYPCYFIFKKRKDINT